MKNRKPNIGVTGPDKGGTTAWWFTRFAIWLHGGKAIRLRPADEENIPPDLHGLVIGGGADINPERYGQERLKDFFTGDQKPSGIRQWLHKIVAVVLFPFIFLLRKILSTKESAIDKKRDEMEFRLMEKAIVNEWPILGICRGAQLINIRFGGDLYQDLTDFYAEIPRVNSVFPKKKVIIDENSRLGKILEYDRVLVNALHKQAVNKLGEQLKIVAREESGVTQAIEHTGFSFLIGVQWHPEYLPQVPVQRQIFKTLVEEASEVLNAANQQKAKQTEDLPGHYPG